MYNRHGWLGVKNQLSSEFRGYKYIAYSSRGIQSSGAVWKSRWPSWAPRPWCCNSLYGLCGHKAALNWNSNVGLTE